MGSQNEAHECKDCGLKVTPPAFGSVVMKIQDTWEIEMIEL